MTPQAAVRAMASDQWERRAALERLVGAQQRRLYHIALAILRATRARLRTLSRRAS